MCVNNYYKEANQKLTDEFNMIKQSNELKNSMVQVTDWVDVCNHNDSVIPNDEMLLKCDCSNGRLLTQNGIFSCPFLSNDYRGRMGSDFKDFSQAVRLETDFCSTCIKNKEPMFSINIV